MRDRVADLRQLILRIPFGNVFLVVFLFEACSIFLLDRAFLLDRFDLAIRLFQFAFHARKLLLLIRKEFFHLVYFSFETDFFRFQLRRIARHGNGLVHSFVNDGIGDLYFRTFFFDQRVQFIVFIDNLFLFRLCFEVIVLHAVVLFGITLFRFFFRLDEFLLFLRFLFLLRNQRFARIDKVFQSFLFAVLRHRTVRQFHHAFVNRFQFVIQSFDLLGNSLVFGVGIVLLFLGGKQRRRRRIEFFLQLLAFRFAVFGNVQEMVDVKVFDPRLVFRCFYGNLRLFFQRFDTSFQPVQTFCCKV